MADFGPPYKFVGFIKNHEGKVQVAACKVAALSAMVEFFNLKKCLFHTPDEMWAFTRDHLSQAASYGYLSQTASYSYLAKGKRNAPTVIMGPPGTGKDAVSGNTLVDAKGHEFLVSGIAFARHSQNC